MAVAGCAAVMFLMQRAGGAVVSLGTVSIPARFLRAALVYVSYLRISVWPVNLSPYTVPEVESYGRALAAGGALALLTVGAIWAARRARIAPQPWLPVGWFWFLGTLVPTIGLVQVGTQVLADRFLYLPQIGLWIAVVWTAAGWVESRTLDENGDISDSCEAPGGPFRRIRDVPVFVLVAALVLAVFTAAAWRQTARWQNSETLWTHALACDEEDSSAHVFMGLALHAQHRDDLAEDHFRAALRADPDSRTAYCALGWLLEEEGDLDGAIRWYTEAIDHFDNMPEGEYSLGNVLWKKGDLRGAESHLTRAIALRADFAQPRVSLAQLRHQQGADDKCDELCREALEFDPGLVEAHVLLANSAARHGNMADAAEHLRIAMEINPHLPDEYLNLGLTSLRQGKHEAALRLFQAAMTLQPNDVRAVEIAAQLLATDPDPAVRNGKEAVELRFVRWSLAAATPKRSTLWPPLTPKPASSPMRSAPLQPRATWPPPAGRIWPPIFSGGWTCSARARHFTRESGNVGVPALAP